MNHSKSRTYTPSASRLYTKEASCVASADSSEMINDISREGTRIQIYKTRESPDYPDNYKGQKSSPYLYESRTRDRNKPKPRYSPGVSDPYCYSFPHAQSPSFPPTAYGGYQRVRNKTQDTLSATYITDPHILHEYNSRNGGQTDKQSRHDYDFGYTGRGPYFQEDTYNWSMRIDVPDGEGNDKGTSKKTTDKHSCGIVGDVLLLICSGTCAVVACMCS